MIPFTNFIVRQYLSSNYHGTWSGKVNGISLSVLRSVVSELFVKTLKEFHKIWDLQSSICIYRESGHTLKLSLVELYINIFVLKSPIEWNHCHRCRQWIFHGIHDKLLILFFCVTEPGIRIFAFWLQKYRRNIVMFTES